MGLFSGIKDALFGSEPEVDIQSRSTLNPQQQRLLSGTLMPYLSQPISNVRAKDFHASGGNKFTAPMTAGEWASLEALEQAALQPQPQSAGQSYLQQSLASDDFGQANLQYLNPYLNAQPEDIDAYFKSTVANPLLEQFEEDILPMISRRAAGSGNYFGSDRVNADQRATEELIDTLGRERTRLAYEARESALNRGIQAAGMATNAELEARDQAIETALAEAGIDQDRASFQLQAIVQNLQAQGLPREARNEEIARQYADFLRKEGVKDTRIAQIISTLGLQTQENIATVKPGTTGLVQSFLGGGGGAAIGNWLGGR